MPQDGFFRSQTYAHHLGRLVRELGVALCLLCFLHVFLFPIPGVSADASRKMSNLQGNILRGNPVQEEVNSSSVRG